MGAKQRAQARGKSKKSPQGAMKGSPWSQKQSSSSLSVRNLDPSLRHMALQGWQDFASSESAASTPRNGFSMAQEARNTERHTAGWGTSRLRGNAVAFVSAGNLTRDEQQSSDDEEEDMEEDAPMVEEDTQRGETSTLNVLLQPTEKEPLRKIVTTPPTIAERKATAMQQDQDGSSESSSEGEEILFLGRTNPPLGSRAPPSRNITATNGSQPPAPSTQPRTDPISISHSTQPPKSAPLASSSEAPSSWKPRRNRAGRLAGRRRHPGQQVSDEEEALMQDYIANMAMDDDEDAEDDEESSSSKPQRRNETFRFYDGAGDENIKVQLKSKLSKTSYVEDFDEAADWDSADLDDFDDLATTDEDVDEIGQVLRHRDRPSGAQYLVTPVGKGAGDAKWMLHSRLTSNTAVEEIRTYHEIQTMRIEVEEDNSDESSDEDEDDDALDDLMDDIESEDDENAQILLRTAKMSDEQIARALAKQEELGLGSDELVLFDGQEGEDEDDGQPFDPVRNGADFIPFSISKHTSNRGRTKKNRRQRDSFPSGEAFADALDQDPYGAFDVMDFDRPSVRPKRKGKKNDFDFDLSDDELAQHLRTTWQKDRDKKAQRRIEKMEALESLLAEAAERNHPAAIKGEIRRFMIEETEVLKLAPMDAHVRAGVHRLAKSLKLNSKSEGKDGKGAGRYPVLTKTAYTPAYTIHTIWEIDALMESKKFFPRQMAKAFKTPKGLKSAGKARGGGGIADASLRNGEVVGGWAPELAADNKGRAMLEKMGWSTGMGIGAVGNKGALEAIRSVVKNNKAGLG